MASKTVVLTPEELLNTARICASQPDAIVDHLHGGGAFSWDWPVDTTDRSKGVVRVYVQADRDQIVTDSEGTTWAVPYHLEILQQFHTGGVGERMSFEFRPDTALGIENSLPRPALAALIARVIRNAQPAKV